MEKVYFYAPNRDTHHLFNQESQQWMELLKGRSATSGNFTSWIVSTYFHVKQAGLSCDVVDHIPKEGIVITDRDTLGNKYPYLGKAMLICAKGDREFHPSAHLHVVHNPFDVQNKKNSLWNPYCVPHWSQPNLIREHPTFAKMPGE